MLALRGDPIGEIGVGLISPRASPSRCFEGRDLLLGAGLPALPAGDVGDDVPDALGADLPVTLDASQANRANPQHRAVPAPLPPARF